MHHKSKRLNVHTELDRLESQLVLAKEMNLISQLELFPSFADVYFSSTVTYNTIHKVVRHINREYKRVAWIPSSLYLCSPQKYIKIHYKRDQS